MPRTHGDLGPYAAFVAPDGSLSEGFSITNYEESDTEAFNQINYVRYSNQLFRFSRRFLPQLTRDQIDCVMLASMFRSLVVRKGKRHLTIFRAIADAYDKNIGESAAATAADIDINALFYSIRLAVEVGCSTDKFVRFLSEGLEHAYCSSATAKDALIVLSNNRDVLTLLYDGRLHQSAEERLDDAVQRLVHKERPAS